MLAVKGSAWICCFLDTSLFLRCCFTRSSTSTIQPTSWLTYTAAVLILKIPCRQNQMLWGTAPNVSLRRPVDFQNELRPQSWCFCCPADRGGSKRRLRINRELGLVLFQGLKAKGHPKPMGLRVRSSFEAVGLETVAWRKTPGGFTDLVAPDECTSFKAQGSSSRRAMGLLEADSTK